MYGVYKKKKGIKNAPIRLVEKCPNKKFAKHACAEYKMIMAINGYKKLYKYFYKKMKSELV